MTQEKITVNRKQIRQALPQRWWKALGFGAVFCAVATACSPGTSEQAQAAGSGIATSAETVSTVKIVTLGGTITEIVCALDYCDNIVATDLTSTYPAHMQQLPSLGYRNSVKAEGILSTGADLVLAEKDYLSTAVVEQLKSTGVEQHFYENKLSKESTQDLIKAIGKLLQKEEKAQELVNEIDSDFAEVDALLAKSNSKPKVLFVYARGQGTLNIGGQNTFAEAIINLAGGQLAVPQIEDFKPLTAEAVIAANPDYLLFFDTGLQGIGGIEGVLNIPGVQETRAGKNRNIIAMDGQFLSGFGPRVGKAVLELATQLHPEVQQTATASR